MSVFVAVVERGSLTAAADALDLSRAMVTRYLAELERWTGARLLHRTTRRVSLTGAGELALERFRGMLEIGAQLRDELAADDPEPHGALRVTASMSFGHSQLAGAVADFVQRYRHARVDLLLVDRAVNLIEERVDVAVRIAREIEPGLIARRLATCRSVICAAPVYLDRHGTPARAEALAAHNCLTHHFVGRSLWHFRRDGQPLEVTVSGSVSANEATVLMEATLAGVGVSMLPLYLVGPAIARGELVVLLPDHALEEEMSVFAVYASRQQQPAVVRAFLDFLAQRFGKAGDW